MKLCVLEKKKSFSWGKMCVWFSGSVWNRPCMEWRGGKKEDGKSLEPLCCLLKSNLNFYSFDSKYRNWNVKLNKLAWRKKHTTTTTTMIINAFSYCTEHLFILKCKIIKKYSKKITLNFCRIGEGRSFIKLLF